MQINRLRNKQKPHG